jgi:hypothetical protein
MPTLVAIVTVIFRLATGGKTTTGGKALLADPGREPAVTAAERH